MILMDTVEELVKGADTVVKILPINGHDVKVTLARKGQNIPSSSDRVQVSITVSLPAVDGFVVKDLCFGMRASLMGEWLFTSWGENWKGNTERHNTDVFLGTTWREAAERAVISVGEGIVTLMEQVSIRKKALEDADEKH